MNCYDCYLYELGYCRLKYKSPVTGEPITSPLKAIDARSFLWACSNGSFGSTVAAPIYEKMMGTFTHEEIDVHRDGDML